MSVGGQELFQISNLGRGLATEGACQQATDSNHFLQKMEKCYDNNKWRVVKKYNILWYIQGTVYGDKGDI